MQNNQRGLIHIIVVLILLAGIVATVWLVTQGPLKLFPKAGVSKPLPPETSLTLIGPNDCAEGFFCALQLQKDPLPGEEFEVKLFARSDIDEANLFQARMKFPKDLLEVVNVKTSDSIIKNWVENFYDNNAGVISLVGGVPAPGYKSTPGGESALMATITFKAKVEGKGTVSFADDSAIYRNINNVNILGVKRDANITVDKGGEYCTVAFSLSNENPLPNSFIQVKVRGLVDKAGWQNVELYLDGKTQDFAWGGIENPWPTFVYNKVPAGSLGPHTLKFTTDQGKRTCAPEKTFNTQATPSPTPKPSPGNKGDGNSDGKINLVDMSVLLTDFNKEKGYREPIDMNDDKKINTFDFSLHRKLLIDLGIIKGQ